MNRKKQSNARALLTTALATLCVVGLVVLPGDAELDSIVTDPSGRFEIQLYRYASTACSPGGTSTDGAGLIVLFDKKEKRILKMHHLDLVQSWTKAHWSPCGVSIRLIADWELPSRPGVECGK